jgi:uncharacterized damage-inducible protein DinB
MADSAPHASHPAVSTVEATRLYNQLDSVFRGSAWHGPALMELLSGVDAAVAAAHPMHNVHSIWEIVLHLTTWKLAVQRRLNGESFRVTPQQDWPHIEQFTDMNWQHAVTALESAHNGVLDAVSMIDDARLCGEVPGEAYDCRFMLQGLVNHDAYHAGQIAMLKKAQ